MKSNLPVSKDQQAEQFTDFQLQHLLDSLLTVVFSIDQDGNFSFVNNTAFEVWGYHPQELIGTPFLRLVVEEDKESTWNYFKKVSSGSPVLHFENCFQRKDGSTVPISWAGRWSEQDKILYCAVRDISERKQMMSIRQRYQGELKQRNQEMIDLLERITDAFFAVDRNWTVTYFNRQAENLAKISRGEIIYKSLWQCFPNAIGTTIESNLKRSLKEQVPVCFESMSTVQPILLEFSVYPSQNGLTVFYRDITQKRKTEEELQKLSFIAKETCNAVCLVELDGRISWVNNAFTRITGFTAEEAIGRKNNELLIGEETNLDGILEMNERLKNKEQFRCELIGYTKSDTKIWLEISGQPMRDKEGNVLRFFIIQTDISERKKLEQQLGLQQKMLTSAVIAAQEKEREQVSRELHDNVNQVLTTVKLYSELCRDGFGDTKEIMNKSIKLLQDSINEIRSLSKRLSVPSLNYIKVKDSVKELVDSITATNKLSLSLDTSAIDDLEIGSELHLGIYRILQEHLTNILKHAEAYNVQILFVLSDDDLVLKVVDDGKGFDINRKRDGIGIANMIMRAQSLNGTLNINSAPGLGCVLIAQFPLQAR
jgi:PAS domain S-box-containing protein